MSLSLQLLFELVLLLFLPFLLLLTLRQAFSRKARLPPSPPKLPFIGNLHQLGALPHRSLRALAKKHGPLMLLHLGQVPTLIVSSAEMAREIMRTHDHIFASRPPMKAGKILLFDAMDIGLAPYGEYWRYARKLCIVHLLSNKKVQSFRCSREEEVAFMIKNISRASITPDPVNVSEILHAFANDMLCRVVSGKFFREGGRNKLFRELIRENSALIGGFHLGDYFPSLEWMDVFFGMCARARRNAKRWSGVLDDVIKEHADQVKDETHEKDFVDVLLSLHKDPGVDLALTKEDIKALLVDMFGAGTDTSYIVLEWAMAELIRNSQAMEKLQDEVRGIVSGKDLVREEDLSELSYLKAVIKEVLRLHPPAPLLLPRESMDDCHIEGYEIPRRIRVIVNGWAICRDPKVWEAPEEFRPERFMGNQIDFKGNDFQFIPFGSGRRICPGMNFAISTVELALANLIQCFDWELPHGMAKEDLDMDEAPGLTNPMKKRLHLVAKPRGYYMDL
ncbi:cytochrome P450 71A1 [Elaeis guineensis]|uniref:Cytochrome P450 71A1 isoform X1 n=1 Tax=Elaeis guineensis var. tenera TaxID=51953 RepID=A0A6I9QKS9_ELAGV|nr:cytochrome P450 71A1 isoform X1 [Elaeis guineensis]